jgi:glycerol-3-phosphate dehydrogenase
MAARAEAWARLRSEPWDLLVVGGGITGAGLLHEAARRGLRAALVEARDFAFGSSSRSGKLVHGGLRYLKQLDFRLTFAAVSERERLLREARGLVEPLGFLAPVRRGGRLDGFLLGVGLALYDVMAGRVARRRLDRDELLRLAPHLGPHGLRGGLRFEDAQTDDARLVLRLLSDAQRQGALALNRVAARGPLLAAGQVRGLVLCDVVSGVTAEVQARVVVNATGAAADGLRGAVGEKPRLRPLRGSHLTFPAWRLPASQAVMFLHPRDRRPVYVLPWEGVTLVGTTDLDHDRPPDEEPAISPAEADYLMEGLRSELPSLELTAADALASFSGVRPVVRSGRLLPSQEPREHVVWSERGLLTVAGGKLTTFRLIASDALRASGLPLGPARQAPAIEDLQSPLDDAELLRLVGRHGAEAGLVVACARDGELARIPGTHTLWAELRHAARHEAVLHLDDLLLRRVRLGLQLPRGGAGLLERVRAICQPELGWDDERWTAEEQGYRQTWARAYAPPA